MLHGAIVLDPRNFNGTDNATESATALHYAAIEAGRFVQSLEPDLLLLVTPHGLALPEPFLLYNNPSAAGSVSVDSWLPCSFPPCTYNASAQLDVSLTKRLEAALSGCGGAVTSISGFGPPGQGALPLPLAWAEVIPLYFLSKAFEGPAQQRQQERGQQRQQQSGQPQPQQEQRGQGQGQGTARRLLVAAEVAEEEEQAMRRQQPKPCRAAQARPGASAARRPGASRGRSYTGDGPAPTNGTLPPLVVLSMPSRRYEHAAAMVPELLDLGRALFAQLDSLDERIAIIVSGDLAHTWDPTGPYGFSEAAGRFDSAVTAWARDLDRAALIKTAAKNVEEAKSCGFPGMVLLQGVMDGVKPDNMHSVLLEYGHPSYYGMMCAVFDFQGDA